MAASTTTGRPLLVYISLQCLRVGYDSRVNHSSCTGQAHQYTSRLASPMVSTGADPFHTLRRISADRYLPRDTS